MKYSPSVLVTSESTGSQSYVIVSLFLEVAQMAHSNPLPVKARKGEKVREQDKSAKEKRLGARDRKTQALVEFFIDL
jgi:hypothetical protein